MKLNTRMPEKAIKPHRMELVLPDKLIEVLANKGRDDELHRKLDALLSAEKPAPVVVEKERIIHAEPVIEYVPRPTIKGEDFVLSIERDTLGHIETIGATRPGETSAFYVFRIERNFNRGVESITALAQ